MGRLCTHLCNSLWLSHDWQDTDVFPHVPIQHPPAEYQSGDLMDQGFSHSSAVSTSGEPDRRSQEAKWRIGISETDWTVSRKRYFIGMAVGVTVGWLCGRRHVIVSAWMPGIGAFSFFFFMDFHCLGNKTVVTVGFCSTFEVKSKVLLCKSDVEDRLKYLSLILKIYLSSSIKLGSFKISL